MQLPPWRQMASGFAVAVFALVFLASVTQAHAQHSSDGQAIEGHLKHLVVASHNPTLAVLKSDNQPDDNTADSTDTFAALLTVLLWDQPVETARSQGHQIQHPSARPHYRTPQLRAPPTA
jgi:hypothetical protein